MSEKIRKAEEPGKMNEPGKNGETGKTNEPGRIHSPVVIMAGGEGTRMRPLTLAVPKALLPYSKNTVIDEIIERFTSAGCSDFYLAVCYLSDVIRSYFSGDHRNGGRDCRIDFVESESHLGTAGCLFLLRDKVKETFFVSNCDILVDVDLCELLEHHRACGNSATMVTAVYQYEIPAGAVMTGSEGDLLGFDKKVNGTYRINTGLYVLEPEVIDFIGDNEQVHMPSLFLRIKDSGKRAGVFDVPGEAYTDLGNIRGYMSALAKEMYGQSQI